MAFTVFVDGQEGTTGLRIHEVLAGRRDVELLKIDADKRKDAGERARLLNAADVAFLCLPDAAAREAVALVENPRTCLIDASTAHSTVPGCAPGRGCSGRTATERRRACAETSLARCRARGGLRQLVRNSRVGASVPSARGKSVVNRGRLVAEAPRQP